LANPILDDSGISSPQSIYESSANQQHALGTMAHLDDGRRYAYARAGSGTLIKGQLHIAPAIVALNGNLAVGSAVGAGLTVIPDGVITNGADAIAANEYREGRLYVTDGLDQGSSYKIRSHEAIASSGTNLRIELYDAIATAWDATTTVTFHPNSYDKPTVSATLGNPVGVPQFLIAANEYGWMQTDGLAAVLIDGTPAISSAVIQSNAVAGAVEVVAVDTTPTVGIMVTTGVDTEYQIVDLACRG
jgi:hypothetical protein